MISWIRNFPHSMWGNNKRGPTDEEKDVIRSEALKIIAANILKEYVDYLNHTDWSGNDLLSREQYLSTAAKAMGLEKEIRKDIVNVRIMHLNHLDAVSRSILKRSEEILERALKKHPS